MFYPDFNELLRLGYRVSKVNLLSRRKVHAVASGDHDSPFRGRGLEFEEVRAYVPGDDVRNIDWRVTARTGVPHLKLFTEERERSIVICTDMNNTMRFGTRGTFKSVQAARVAALLGWVANHEHNRVGGSFFGNVPKGNMFVNPSRSRRALLQIIKQLCDKENNYNSRVMLENHLCYLSKAVPSDSLVFIISDFLNVSSELKKMLSNLHRRADVVLVAVNDPADKFLPSIGCAAFKNIDGEALVVDTDNKEGRLSYEQYWTKNREELENIIFSLGLGYINVQTNDDVYKVLIGGLKEMNRKGRCSRGTKPNTAATSFAA